MKGSYYALVALVFYAAAADATLTRTKKPAWATFRVKGPIGTSLEGKTDAVQVIDHDATVSVIVDLRALSTGMKLRDDHMRNNYLETKRFPTTRLDVDRRALRATPGARFDERAKGTLTLHGVKKEISFAYRGTCDAHGVCDVKARMPLNMIDFGIVVDPFLGLTVESEVTVDVQLQVQS